MEAGEDVVFDGVEEGGGSSKRGFDGEEGALKFGLGRGERDDGDV